MAERKIRVLIVDDAALIRASVRKILEDAGDFEIVGTASQGEVALRKIAETRPDVVTMDIDMPGMNGIELVRRIMSEAPVPTVMFSGHTREGAQRSFDALEAGAVDFVAKPGAGEGGILSVGEVLATKLRDAASARASVAPVRKPAAKPVVGHGGRSGAARRASASRSAEIDRVVAVGISMGGPATLAQMFPSLPEDVPPIVITLHMPESYTASYAERLNSLSKCEVREARTGDRLRPGLVLLARGDHHMRVERVLRTYRVALDEGEKVSGHRPSIDVMFGSLAESVGERCDAVLMTGMGQDGVAGLSMIRRAGGRIFVQDEASSVVFGMGSVAVRRGLCDRVLGLEEIGGLLSGELGELVRPG